MYDPTITWEGNKVPLFKAFIAAQSAAEAFKKASSNPAFKTKYADLSSVFEAVVPALNKAGVGVMQFPHFDGETVTVQTVLCHESGSNVTHRLTIRPSKLDAQGIGSAITYGRRYSLLAISGAAPEDDDGKAASGPVEPIQNGQRFDTPKPPTISEWALKVENAMRAAQTLQASLPSSIPQTLSALLSLKRSIANSKPHSSMPWKENPHDRRLYLQQGRGDADCLHALPLPLLGACQA